MDKIYNNFSEFSADYQYDELTDKLGEGGFGTVYRADDLLRNREVVVKVSKVPKEEKYSLLHEFQIVKTLPIHKNIVYYESCNRFKINGLGVYDIAIMDYYSSGNLENFISQTKLTPEQFKEIVAEILAGISFLHKNGIIHRDIKPTNILIAKHKTKFIPKIADFGLGKIKASAEESFTENSFVGGTINYAAPEQILGTKVRSNVDLWSFGVLLYKMCTNKLPFEVGSTDTTGRREQLTRKILNADFSKEIHQVEEPYKQIIKKCLIIDNEKRVKTADELINILHEFKFQSEKTEVFQKQIQPTQIIPKSSPKKTNALIYTVLGTTFFVMLCFVFFLFYKNKEQTIEPPIEIPNIQSNQKEEKPQSNQAVIENQPISSSQNINNQQKSKAKKTIKLKKSKEKSGFIDDYELKR